MNTRVSGPVKTFTAGEALAVCRRVKWSAADTVVYADAGEDFDGVTLAAAANGASVPVQLAGQGGTYLIESAGAITAGAQVYGAADGKIDDTAAGEPIGKANEAASAAAKMIEVIPGAGQTPVQSVISDVTITTDLTGVDTGTDMTAAQAAQIEADLAAIAAQGNAIVDALQAAGIVATS